MPSEDLIEGETVEWVTIFGSMIFLCIITEVVLVIWPFKLATRITFDMLEQLNRIDLAKETIRNIYTNLAIVGALVLTIVFAMLFVPDIVKRAELHPGLSTAYIVSTSFACLQCLRVTFECVINLVYTEALSNGDVIRYIIASPGSIGAPVLGLGFAMIALTVSTTLWLMAAHTVASAAGFAVLALFYLVKLIALSIDKSMFTTDPKDKNAIAWKWAEDEGDANSMMLGAPEIAIARKRATAVLEYEAQHTSV